MFNTTNDVYEWLYNERKAARREDLLRIERCVELLNIKMDYKIVHITGTNGKGSVAANIKSILSLIGMHIGMFVSPYVISFNERIEINDRYISNAEIMYYANKLYDFSNDYKAKYNDTVPFFELTLLMALMYFQDRNIDIAIIECGLGGKLDCTNFIKADLSIITNVGWDHMAQLGNNIEDIAKHKLGILKDNGYLITAVDESLYPMFNDYAKSKNASINYILNTDITDINIGTKTTFKYKNIPYESSLLGIFQATNASIAIEAAKYLLPDIPYDLVQFGLSNVKWPGRMEVLNTNPAIIIDGGHNISAIEASTNTLKLIKHGKKIKVMFNALIDKDYKSMINKLDEIADSYYFTSISDLRASDPNLFKECTKKKSIIINSIDECLASAINELKDDEILFITGSLHFISIVREKYLK